MSFNVLISILLGSLARAEDPYLQRARMAMDVMNRLMDRSYAALDQLEAFRTYGSQVEKDALTKSCELANTDLDSFSITSEYELSEFMYDVLSATGTKEVGDILGPILPKITE